MGFKLAVVLVLAISAVAPAGAAQSGRVRRVNPPPNTQPATAPPASTPADPPAPTRATPQNVVAKFDGKYAGGSLGFEMDQKVTVDIRDGKLTFNCKGTQVAVEATRVNDFSYGTRVRQRTAEGVGVGSVIPGLGGIIGNTKSTAHYIEIVWDAAPAQGIALRLDKGNYQDFIHAVESVTGLTVRREPELVKDLP